MAFPNTRPRQTDSLWGNMNVNKAYFASAEGLQVLKYQDDGCGGVHLQSQYSGIWDSRIKKLKQK